MVIEIKYSEIVNSYLINLDNTFQIEKAHYFLRFINNKDTRFIINLANNEDIDKIYNAIIKGLAYKTYLLSVLIEGSVESEGKLIDIMTFE